MLVSVVIPFRNEAASVTDLLESLNFMLKPFLYELIFVDDNSNKDEFEILQNISFKYNFVNIIRNKTRIGQHASIIKGIHSTKGDYILVMSADLQEQFNIIPKMISLCSHYDLIYGERMKRNDGIFNDLSSNIANRFIKNVILSRYPKSGFDYYIFKSSYKCLLQEENFVIPQIALLKNINDFTSIPYVRNKRKHSKTKWTFINKVSLFFKIIYYYGVKEKYRIYTIK